MEGEFWNRDEGPQGHAGENKHPAVMASYYFNRVCKALEPGRGPWSRPRCVCVQQAEARRLLSEGWTGNLGLVSAAAWAPRSLLPEALLVHSRTFHGGGGGRRHTRPCIVHGSPPWTPHAGKAQGSFSTCPHHKPCLPGRSGLPGANSSPEGSRPHRTCSYEGEVGSFSTEFIFEAKHSLPISWWEGQVHQRGNSLLKALTGLPSQPDARGPCLPQAQNTVPLPQIYAKTGL